jgi:phosphoglycolate phosphatase
LIPKFPVYLFDVDGTLLDSAADICCVIQTALAQTLQADVSHQLLRTYIGRHLDELFQDLFPGCTRQDMDRMLAAYGTYWIITHVQLA